MECTDELQIEVKRTRTPWTWSLVSQIFESPRTVSTQATDLCPSASVKQRKLSHHREARHHRPAPNRQGRSSRRPPLRPTPVGRHRARHRPLRRVRGCPAASTQERPERVGLVLQQQELQGHKVPP